MTPVIIFGSGGLAKEVIGYIESDGEYYVEGIVSTEPCNNPAYPYEVRAAVDPKWEGGYILAVAEPAVKRAIVAANLDKWITYAHSSAHISPYATIGRGCVFAPQSILAGDPVLGRFVFLNTNATVGHDSVVGSYVTLYPNTEICGDCGIGEDVIFGIGAYAFPKVTIVKGAKVSAGAVVRKSVLTPVTVYGDPAKPAILPARSV